MHLIVLLQAIKKIKQSWKNHNHYLSSFLKCHCILLRTKQGYKYTLNTLFCYHSRLITQTKHEHKQHHYLLNFHCSCAFLWGSHLCTNMIFNILLWYPMLSTTQPIMENRTTTTYYLLAMPLHSSEVQTRVCIIYWTPYCATPVEQYNKQSMNISTITTYLLFTLAVHSNEDQIHSQIWYFTHYYEHPCHQQPKQTMIISTIITCLLFTLHFTLFRGWHIVIHKLLYTLLCYPMPSTTQSIMAKSTTTTYYLLAIPLHSSEDQTRV